MPDESYNVNMHIIFYDTMLLGKTVSPKRLKLCNKAVTIHANMQSHIVFAFESLSL